MKQRLRLNFMAGFAGLMLLAAGTAQCDSGYVFIDSTCYWEMDIQFLEILIDQSQNTIDMGLDDDNNGMVEPLELGYQNWLDGRLVIFSCYNCGLSGLIPESIGNLDLLRELNLGSNYLSGTIPNTLLNLTLLEILYLNGNDISGSIPSDIGDLSLLEKLYLHENQISGIIPSSLGNIQSLERLYLSMNQISGEIPAELGNCTSLQRLYLRNNELTGPVPSSLGNLIELEYLLLHDNQLSGILPGELGQLHELGWLWLHNNHFSGAEDGICSINIEWDQASCGDAPYFMAGNNYFCSTLPVCFEIANFLNYGWDEDNMELLLLPQDCSWIYPGNLNDDYAVDILDITLMVGFIIGTCIPSDQQFYNGDLNQDQTLDVLDVMLLVGLILD